MRLLTNFVVAAVFFAIPAGAAAPCAAASSACTEWVVFGGGPARSLIYRSYALDAPNPQITRAFIMVHGQGRNADDYFRTAMASAFLGGGLEDTVVISPRFASADRGCTDKLDADEVNWPCSGDSWRSGAAARGNERLTSYDFVDEILRKLARKQTFPNLKRIVVAGHSAGGQYVSRYAMANRVHENLGVPVTYVVSNPSSYAYPDANRPRSGDAPAEVGPYGDSRNCTTYNNWPYGLEKRTGYSAAMSDDELRKQYVKRPVVYLLGELDTLPLAGFDSSCPAMAQGPFRLARGQSYAAYMNGKYGATHKVTVVPLCGHNARCMFTADPALAIVFTK
jgi:pimeloyl-ACP methyl ester carboxylesterase